MCSGDYGPVWHGQSSVCANPGQKNVWEQSRKQCPLPSWKMVACCCFWRLWLLLLIRLWKFLNGHFWTRSKKSGTGTAWPSQEKSCFPVRLVLQTAGWNRATVIVKTLLQYPSVSFQGVFFLPVPSFYWFSRPWKGAFKTSGLSSAFKNCPVLWA